MNHFPVEAGTGGACGAGGSRVLSLGSSIIGTCAFLLGHFPHGEAAAPRKHGFVFELRVLSLPLEADGDLWGC